MIYQNIKSKLKNQQVSDKIKLSGKKKVKTLGNEQVIVISTIVYKII